MNRFFVDQFNERQNQHCEKYLELCKRELLSERVSFVSENVFCERINLHCFDSKCDLKNINNITSFYRYTEIFFVGIKCGERW